MIDLAGVCKSFGPVAALRPTTLAVPDGRTTVLIGPSGCGKSTLLRLVLGLTWPDAGKVRFDGVPVTPATVRSVRLRAGYVVQDGGLFPHLTARGNVTLMARQLGWAKERIAARVAELAKLARLPADSLDRYPVQLSGGQRQRVGLMRALMLDPPALLLDEPMAALDPLVRADLRADLKAIFRELHKTVLLVTHDLAEAAALGDRVVLMRDGAIVQEGPMAELESAPADPFVTRFIHAQRSGPTGEAG
jgi:osmoprotectant transport system ATP-binding protein